MDVYNEKSITTNEPSFVAMKEEWEKRFVLNKILENDRISIVAEYKQYLNDLYESNQNISYSSQAQYHELLNKIEKYCEQKHRIYTTEEFSREMNFISFGNWIRENPSRKGAVKLKAYTVRGNLNKLNIFFKYLLREDKEREINTYSRKFLTNHWHGIVKKPILTEDMYQAIIHTEIEVTENDPRSLNERGYLDTLKLMLNHGFRYSDLFSLTRDDITTKIINGKAVDIFEFVQPKPKKDKESVKIVFAPGTREIIDFWEKHDTTNYVTDSRVAKDLKYTELGKHLKKEIVEFPNLSKPVIRWVNEFGLVKMPSANIDQTTENQFPLRKRVFAEIQKTWLKLKFGINEWEKHINEPIGFMKEVIINSFGVNRKRYYYETLAFHFCRHTFISRALNTLGISLPHVQYLAGHSSVTTTADYVHSIEDECHESQLKAYENQGSEIDTNAIMRIAN
jgi:site-specific recombinase XerD